MKSITSWMLFAALFFNIPQIFAEYENTNGKPKNL